MKILKSANIVTLLLFFFASLPAASFGAEIRLSVAASMTDAIKELAAVYIDKKHDITILPNFSSSGSLAKQISQGAPVDLFISANNKWMDHLVQENKIDRHTVRVFACNSLVYIGQPEAVFSSLEGLPSSVSRIAIGSPQSVPAGQYAEQTMRAAGIYEKLVSGKKLVLAKDVRQALLYADREEVDGAFVYKTDALLAEHAVILFTIPANLHDRIEYPIGLTLEGIKNEAAKSFFTFLTSPAALETLKKYGFSEPTDASSETLETSLKDFNQ